MPRSRPVEAAKTSLNAQTLMPWRLVGGLVVPTGSSMAPKGRTSTLTPAIRNRIPLSPTRGKAAAMLVNVVQDSTAMARVEVLGRHRPELVAEGVVPDVATPRSDHHHLACLQVVDALQRFAEHSGDRLEDVARDCTGFRPALPAIPQRRHAHGSRRWRAGRHTPAARVPASASSSVRPRRRARTRRPGVRRCWGPRRFSSG